MVVWLWNWFGLVKKYFFIIWAVSWVSKIFFFHQMSTLIGLKNFFSWREYTQRSQKSKVQKIMFNKCSQKSKKFVFTKWAHSLVSENIFYHLSTLIHLQSLDKYFCWNEGTHRSPKSRQIFCNKWVHEQVSRKWY